MLIDCCSLNEELCLCCANFSLTAHLPLTFSQSLFLNLSLFKLKQEAFALSLLGMTLLKPLWCSQVQRTQPPPEEEEDAEEEETEELGHVDTFAEYKPSKCRPLDWMSTSGFFLILHMRRLSCSLPLTCLFFPLSSATIGISHPDIVVETNTLSSVPPPDITYTLSIAETTISSGLLSALQLEAIIYACQVHTHTDRLAYAQRSAYSFWKYKWLMRWLCWLLFVHAFCFLCTLSNTRLFFRTTRGQASWSEMEQGSERDALWQESSWRTTLREGRKHYGKRERGRDRKTGLKAE